MNEHEKALPAGGPAKLTQNAVKIYVISSRERLLLPLAFCFCLLLVNTLLWSGPTAGLTASVCVWYGLLGLYLGRHPAEHLGEPRSAGGESGPGRHAGPGVQLVFPGVGICWPCWPCCPSTPSASPADNFCPGGAPPCCGSGSVCCCGALRPSGGSIGHRLASEKGRRRPAGPAPAAGGRPAPWRCWRSWCPFWPPPTRCSPPPRRTCGPLSPSTSRTRSGRPCWPAS